MATNGNTTTNGFMNGNGNGRYSTRRKIGLESLGFVVAEGVSMVTGLGVVAIADQVIPKSVMKAASQTVGKVIVEPFLDNIETGMSKLCKLEECQVDPNKSRAERAEQIGKTLIVFGAAYALSMTFKLWTRRWANKKFGIPEEYPIAPAANATTWQKIKHYGTLQHVLPEEKLIFAADEAVHLGSLYLLNNQLAPFTDDMIKATTSMLHKTTGMQESKAHEIATMAWVWEAANGLGALAGIGMIAGKHAFGWPGGAFGKFLGKHHESHVDKLAHAAHGTSLPTHS